MARRSFSLKCPFTKSIKAASFILFFRSAHILCIFIPILFSNSKLLKVWTQFFVVYALVLSFGNNIFDSVTFFSDRVFVAVSLRDSKPKRRSRARSITCVGTPASRATWTPQLLSAFRQLTKAAFWLFAAFGQLAKATCSSFESCSKVTFRPWKAGPVNIPTYKLKALTCKS